MTPIEPARSSDLEGALRLLAASELPVAGFADWIGSALVARGEARDQLEGCVALELHGEEALLRSLVVAPSARGSGLGVRLTEAALALARDRGAARVWLLTTTADRFFPRFGFREAVRAELPVALETSEELRGACPASAIAMRLELAPEPSPAP